MTPGEFEEGRVFLSMGKTCECTKCQETGLKTGEGERRFLMTSFKLCGSVGEAWAGAETGALVIAWGRDVVTEHFSLENN